SFYAFHECRRVLLRSLHSNTQRDDTPKVSGLWCKIGQKIENLHCFNLVPATPILVLTPTGVYRLQMEKKPYPTTFHPDTRAPETLYLPIDPDLIGDEGTVSFWAYEDGSDRSEERRVGNEWRTK